MAARKGMRKVCANGHVFHKSSDCPSCPICEAERKPVGEFLAALGAPARRALERAGILTAQQLAKHTEGEILKLHGMGPSSIPKLKQALAAEELQFKRDQASNGQR
jgi:predicted RecB family nuclease